jgi:putative tricarboxylic transport membrane protein
MTTDLHKSTNVRAILIHRGAALLFTAVAAYYVLEALTYPYMDNTGPGAGFFPLWIGGLALLVGLGLFVTARRAADDAGPPESVEPGSRRAVIVTLVALCVAAAVLESLGFRITTFLMLFVLLKAYGASLRMALAASVAASLFIFALFQALHVQLPVGSYGF